MAVNSSSGGAGGLTGNQRADLVEVGLLLISYMSPFLLQFLCLVIDLMSVALLLFSVIVHV